MRFPCSLRLTGIVVCLLIAVWQRVEAATHTWTGGGGNALWSNNANWSGGKPTSGESGGTIVAFGSGTATTCDIAGLIVNQIHFTGGGNTISGTTALTINGGILRVNILSSTGTNTMASSLPLIYATGECFVEVTAGGLTISGNMSGGVSMRKLGTGTLTVTGNSSYAGTTVVADGTLSLNSNGINTAIPGAVTVGDGNGGGGSAVLILQQNTEIADSAAVTVESDGKFDLNNSLETIGSLTINEGSVFTNGDGTGHLQVGNATTVNNGLINIGTGKVTLAGPLNMTGGIVVAINSGLLTLGGDVTATSAPGAGGVIAGNIKMNGWRNFTVNPGNVQPELTVNGSIADGNVSSGLKKSGTGTLKLMSLNGNTYTGTTNVDKGRVLLDATFYGSVPGALVIGNDNDDPGSAVVQEVTSQEIYDNSSVMINGSGVLEMNDKEDEIRTLGGTGTLALTGVNSRLIVAGADTTTFFGLLTGPGTLLKAGNGTLTLKGTAQAPARVTVITGTLVLNFFAGSPIPRTIAVGDGNGGESTAVLRLAANNQLAPDGSIAVDSDGLLDINGTTASAGSLTVTSGNVAIGTGELTLLSTLTMTAGSITGTGAGTLVLGGNVNAGGAGIQSASINCNTALRSTPVFTITSGTPPELTLTGKVRNGPFGSQGFQKSGSGTMRLVAPENNTFTGTVTVNKGGLELDNSDKTSIPGALVIGNAGDAPASAVVRNLHRYNLSTGSPLTINASGLLDLNGYSEYCNTLTGTGKVNIRTGGFFFTGMGGGSSTFDGTLSGTGDLVKDGNGTLTLTGINPLSGYTFISGGTLLINGTQTASPIIINFSGTLGGTGFAGPGVGAVDAGTRILPGDASTGTLSVSGPVNLNSTFAVRLNDAALPKNDHLRVSGNLNITGARLTLVPAGPFSPSTYVIATYGDFGGTLTGTFQSIPAGCSVNYAYNDGVSSNHIALKVNNPYLAWVSSFSLDPGTSGAPTADPDKDGVPNGIEFVQGTDPGRRNAPTDAPAIAASGANVIFTFRRWQTAAYTNPGVQTATDLTGPWTTLSGGAGVTPDFFGPGVDRVTVTIPRANRPRLYCRLMVLIP